MKRDTCKECRFFQIGDPQYIYGMCHRYPPTPDFTFAIQSSKYGEGGSGSISRNAAPIFPNVHQDSWCGELTVDDEGAEK